jgi:hypothetical protein
MPTSLFDLVIPPKHDRLQGDNVFSITGSPNGVNAKRLKAELARFKKQIDALPRPRVAVVIGGKSKAHNMSVERAAALAHEIELPIAQEGGSVMVSFSRRTPEPARALLTARLRHMPGVIWDGEGDNPYFAFLAAADYILVTEDSTNMATDAASTGKPVFILKMDGDSLKFRLFHEEGAARPYGGAFHGWTYEPVDETGRAAREPGAPGRRPAVRRRLPCRDAPRDPPPAEAGADGGAYEGPAEQRAKADDRRSVHDMPIASERVAVEHLDNDRRALRLADQPHDQGGGIGVARPPCPQHPADQCGKGQRVIVCDGVNQIARQDKEGQEHDLVQRQPHRDQRDQEQTVRPQTPARRGRQATEGPTQPVRSRRLEVQRLELLAHAMGEVAAGRGGGPRSEIHDPTGQRGGDRHQPAPCVESVVRPTVRAAASRSAAFPAPVIL